jgi:bacterioferritin
VDSQALKGVTYMAIAKELEQHANEELQHALKVFKHIDYLGGRPTVSSLRVTQTDVAEEMLRADLANENETGRNYRERIRQCESLGECRREPSGNPPSGTGASARSRDGAG